MKKENTIIFEKSAEEIKKKFNNIQLSIIYYICFSIKIDVYI